MLRLRLSRELTLLAVPRGLPPFVLLIDAPMAARTKKWGLCFSVGFTGVSSLPLSPSGLGSAPFPGGRVSGPFVRTKVETS